MSKKGVWLKWGMYGLGILVALLMALWGGVALYLEHQVKSQLTADEYREMQRFLRQPLTVPPEFQDTAPYSAELIHAASQVKAVWEKQEERIGKEVDNATTQAFFHQMRTRQPAAPENWQRVRRIVRGHASYLDKFNACVAMPGYEMGVFAYGTCWPMPNFYLLETSAKLACLAGYARAQEGDWAAAFADGLTGSRVTVNSARAIVIDRLIALHMMGRSAQTVADLARDCTDVPALQSTLTEMDQLRFSVIPKALPDPRLAEIFGALRWYAKQGWALDPQLPRTGSEWLRLHSTLLQMSCQQRDAPLTVEGLRQFSARHSSWRARWADGAQCLGRYNTFRHLKDRLLLLDSSADQDYGSTDCWVELVRALGLDGLADQFLFAGFEQHHPLDWEWPREGTAQAEFDLARLKVATRLQQLAGKGISDFATVAAYLPEEPRDPFTAGPYLWDASDQNFYSAGPDRKDDGDRLVYDPTNGVVSTGDINLR